jgi:hypothetical protein
MKLLLNEQEKVDQVDQQGRPCLVDGTAQKGLLTHELP